MLLVLHHIFLNRAPNKFCPGEAEGFPDLVQAVEKLRSNPHVDLFSHKTLLSHCDHDGGSIRQIATKVTCSLLLPGLSLTLIGFDRHSTCPIPTWCRAGARFQIKGR